MAKRQSNPLTGLEVGVIRNLLAREGVKGQSIHGLINARRRKLGIQEIKSARISEINTGHIRYQGIPPATDEEVDKFIAETDSQQSPDTPSPVSEETLRRLFPLKEGTENFLAVTETNQIECKEFFSQNFFGNCVKAIAAFANSQGGYIVFGVKDKTWEITGINKIKFQSFERAKLSKPLRDHMSSEIQFEMKAVEFGDKSIGILYIHRAQIRPVMFSSQRDNLAIGQIYYRYDATNRLIGPAELQQIINERVEEQSHSVLGKHFSNIMANGIDNSAILNLTTGEVDGKGGNFLIDSDTLSKVNYVKEGEFVEKSGAPALTIVGQIKETVVSKLDAYPFSWIQVWEIVKTAVPSIKQPDFNNLIKEHGLKEKSEYAGYSFRTKAMENNYKETGKVPSGTTSIYNQLAIDFLIAKSKANAKEQE